MSSWVDIGLAAASFTSAPARSSESTRTEVSFVTCRQTPTVIPFEGLLLGVLRRDVGSAVMWPFRPEEVLLALLSEVRVCYLSMDSGIRSEVGLLNSLHRPCRSLVFAWRTSRRRRCRSPSGHPSLADAASSTTNAKPTTFPFSTSTSFAAARAVPPVAMRSSTMSILWPFSMASVWISRVAVPYSRS